MKDTAVGISIFTSWAVAGVGIILVVAKMLGFIGG